MGWKKKSDKSWPNHDIKEKAQMSFMQTWRLIGQSLITNSSYYRISMNKDIFEGYNIYRQHLQWVHCFLLLWNCSYHMTSLFTHFPVGKCQQQKSALQYYHDREHLCHMLRQVWLHWTIMNSMSVEIIHLLRDTTYRLMFKDDKRNIYWLIVYSMLSSVLMII